MKFQKLRRKIHELENKEIFDEELDKMVHEDKYGEFGEKEGK
jgi:hypothetical protein